MDDIFLSFYFKDFCHILDSTLKMAFLTQYHKWQKIFLLNVWVFIFPGYFHLPHLNVLCLPLLLSSFVCCFISISVHRCVYLKCGLFVIFFFLLLFYGQCALDCILIYIRRYCVSKKVYFEFNS